MVGLLVILQGEWEFSEFVIHGAGSGSYQTSLAHPREVRINIRAAWRKAESHHSASIRIIGIFKIVIS